MEKLILVDGNSLMYKAFFAMQPMTNSKGVHTNAIYAFSRMMNNLIKQDYTNILVAFDKGKKTIRHSIVSDYKAGRSPMPDEMRSQIPYIKEFLNIMNIKTYEQDLYEADDIIGILAKQANDKGMNVSIYSSDKDLLQLINDKTTVILTKKGMSDLEEYTPQSFYDKYEINHNQFTDLKALMGDKSDNIKGIPGVGEKTAIKLIKDYKNINGIIDNVNNLKGALKDKVTNNLDVLHTSKQLVTIITDAIIGVSLEDTVKVNKDLEKLIDFYNELGMNSLLKELKANNEVKEVNANIEFEVVSDNDRLKEVLVNNTSLLLEINEDNYHKTNVLVAAIKNNLGSFIINNDLLSNDTFKEFCENKELVKSTYNLKQHIVLLKKYNIELNNVDFDLLLATYILNSLATKEEFKQVASFYELHDIEHEESIYGKGAKRHVPNSDILNKHTISKVNAIYNLKDEVISKLKDSNQYELLTKLEIPLASTLANMEYHGISIDIDELNRQKNYLKSRIDELEDQIYVMTNKEFNISSPKQLGTVLFDELQIHYPKSKTNKSGNYSTDAEVLDQIKDNHDIVPLIILHRQLTKLFSTYIEGLEKTINEDNKVNTIYKQALTQTGRLSSTEPNLQNIPIRTLEGRQIRRMFIPHNKDNTLFAADYSQIELRVLAHMAKVKPLLDAFNNHEDIHVRTAKLIFNKEEITNEDRQTAKAVNFGIIYGMSPYGLSQDLNISMHQAKVFIDKYKEIYPEIDIFMDENINFCKEHGFVKTLLNRTRYIPNINSKMHFLKEFAKRMAMNTPIQGSAADVIKVAMINIDEEIKKRNLKSIMLLQVHDELIFEVNNGEKEILEELVVRNMENAIKLDVPLKVEFNYGKNWYEVK